MSTKKRILLDIDGVLNLYDGKYNPDVIPPKAQYADDFLSELSKDYSVAIFSTRPPELVKKWLDENNLSQYVEDITNVKIPAFLIIDDRCIQFNGNPDDVITQIKNFKPSWKK